MKNRIYPKTIALLITKQCTAQCKMCFECSPQTEEKMPMEWIEKIIEEAALIDDIETIGFSGGEPFLEYINLLKMFKLAKNRNKKVICTSNPITSYKLISRNDTVTFSSASHYPTESIRAGFSRDNINGTYYLSGKFYYNGLN